MGKEQAGKDLYQYQDHDAFFKAQEIKNHWKRRQAWEKRQREKLEPSFGKVLDYSIDDTKDTPLTYSLEIKIDNAVEILYSLYEGIYYVYDKLRKRGLTALKIPDYVLKNYDSISESEIVDDLNLMAAGKLKSFIGYSKTDNKFRIDKWDLKRGSHKYEPFKYYYAKDNQGIISFEGTMPQYYRLIGVEAGHHAIFDTMKPNDKTLASPPNQPMPAIESESEYRALIWKLRYAQEKQYSAETINYLKARLEAIRAYRHSRKIT